MLALVVVSALFVTALSAAVRDHGLRSVVAALAIVVVTFLMEIVGSKTGFPFGEYDYTGALTPQLFGVPIVVAFAWAGITFTVHGALRDVRRGRVVLMACAITAWDTFLDPQMVGEGYWQWQPASPAYRGIPLFNYLGWLLTASIPSAIAVAVCGRPHNDRASELPRITYATLAVLSTIGFAVFFDDMVVAVVGGVAMGIFVWLSYASRTRRVA
jgi:putative membrane protein